MKDINTLFDSEVTRKDFLQSTMTLAVSLSALSLLQCSEETPQKPSFNTGWITQKPESRPTMNVASSSSRVLLKNGIIIDGSGKPPFIGDVMVNNTIIEIVTPKQIVFSGTTIDCTDKIIAPGFIDAHSHLDWILPMDGHPELKNPFMEQGITTVVSGNCGYGVAGFLPKSKYLPMIKTVGKSFFGGDSSSENDNFVKQAAVSMITMQQYLTYCKQHGIAMNMANLAGHGTTQMSLRGYDPKPLNSDEIKTMLYLLEQAMDEGAYGVSFGLQYEPGLFANNDEIATIAKLVKKKDKIVTCHMKAYSALSGTYPLKPFGTPHNIIAINEMIDIAKQTDVRLELSHLIFVGTKTWKTCQDALQIIDTAIDSNLDIMFDTYAYHCGTSVINVFYPNWFLASTPQVYEDKMAMLKLRMQLELIVALLGFGYSDIQIINANHPELVQYNGMLLKDIAKQRNMSQYDNFIDFTKKSNGRARVLNHRYSSFENVMDLMKHPASLFMTDATPYSQGAQNPATYGNYPRFFEIARDYKLLSPQQLIRKMTGAVADRYNLKKRGYLKDGYMADITIVDWKKVKDNNTITQTSNRPSGIDYVFINGKKVVDKGKVTGVPDAGMVL
ncbi:MAG TPA: amidohydrolase family protein [Spirochaetota bacterium]|nr:amidohydrolase family protein [Spirochaetota bacterium]